MHEVRVALQQLQLGEVGDVVVVEAQVRERAERAQPFERRQPAPSEREGGQRGARLQHASEGAQPAVRLELQDTRRGKRLAVERGGEEVGDLNFGVTLR